MSTPGAATPDAPCLRIDLQALAHNWRVVQRACAGAVLGVVLKSDAYGLGVGQVLPTLWALGSRDFWVGTLDEAAALQAQLHALRPSAPYRIYVLHGLADQAPRDWAASGCIPVLAGAHELQRLQAGAGRAGHLPVAVNLDTGLTRLGFGAGDLALLAPGSSSWQHARPCLWLSHLGRFENPQAPQCLAQRERFVQWTARLPAAPRSMASSSSVFAGSPWLFEQVRVGSALWGVSISVLPQPPLQPVASLAAPVLHVREVAAGTEVGYAGRYTTPGPRRVATVALGYADGLPFGLANQGALMLLGRRAPIIGGIAMGLTALDVSAYAPGEVRPGQWAEVYGRQQTLARLAAAAGVAPAALLTLSARLARQRSVEPLASAACPSVVEALP
ncbi:MAG: alanine racemase [Ottowia sp.]|nr:alanine racemase [Ottowia sp.]